MTDCLVIGGGFLGSHVAARLAASGHAVTVYSRSFNPWLDKAGPHAAIRRVDGLLPAGDGLVDLIEAARIVFYLGAASTPTMDLEIDPGGSISSFVVPAAAVLDMMLKTNTRRIVLASSGGAVYGDVHRLPTTEDHRPQPISVHGHNSLTIERYAMFYARHRALEPVVLRYANPYGPGQLSRRGQGVIAAWSDALVHDRPIVVYGDPAATRRDMLFVADAADATVRAGFDAPAPGIYNVGSGRSWSLAELMRRLERVSGGTLRIDPRPDRGVDVPATQLDSTRLHAATGWLPRTELDDGLAATWAWALARRADHP